MATEVGATRPKMPLWVKVFIGIGVVGLLLIVAVTVFGGGQHGPGRHLGGGDEESGSGSHTPPPGQSHAPAQRVNEVTIRQAGPTA